MALYDPFKSLAPRKMWAGYLLPEKSEHYLCSI